MAFEYKIGGEILKRFIDKEGSLESIIFKSRLKNLKGKPISLKKRVFALVINALKKYKLIEDLIKNVKIEENISISIPHYSLVLMTYDLLYRKGISGGGQWKRALLKFQDNLRTQLQQISILGTDEIENIILPRYVRINTLLTTRIEIEGILLKQNLIHGGEATDNNQLDTLCTENKLVFFSDHTITNLLIFPRDSTKLLLPLIDKGYLIFQDKASCLPVHILAPTENSVIIDACAAPGNKTSFLASQLNNTGKIYAFDINKNRLNSMRRNLKKWGITSVETIRKDFLRVYPSDYKNVEYILVDPSCSGSGMINRVKQPSQSCDSNILASRLEKLSNFQVTLLKHALSFPSVRRVVYSTCSVYQEENEMVVKEAMESYGESFQLECVLPEWESRGKKDSFEFGEHCLRASPENNRTIGFFVALFVRK